MHPCRRLVREVAFRHDGHCRLSCPRFNGTSFSPFGISTERSPRLSPCHREACRKSRVCPLRHGVYAPFPYRLVALAAKLPLYFPVRYACLMAVIMNIVANQSRIGSLLPCIIMPERNVVSCLQRLQKRPWRSRK